MSATNRYMNWTGVIFTPAVGSPITITGVVDVTISRGGNPEMFKGDISVFPQVVAVPDRMRTITVTSGDVDAL